MSNPDQSENIDAGHLGVPTLASLAELGARLADQTEPGAMQAAVLTEASQLFGADGGAIALWNDDTKSLVPGETFGCGRTLVEAGLFTGHTVTAHVVNRRLGLYSNDPSRQLGMPADAVAAVIVAPMVTSQRVIGVLAVASTPAGRHFDAQDLALLQVVANFTASVLESTIQFRQLGDHLRLQVVEVTHEMQRAMVELAQVKSFNENIFESISMGIIVFDRSFGVIFRNRLADEVFPDDRNVLGALARTDIASRCEQYEPIFRDVVRLGQVCSFESVRWERPGRDDALILRLTGSPLVGGRQAIVGGILTVEDVTRNVTMEQRLATSERLAAVGKLAAKVAHELNNPLDGILRYISLAARVCGEATDQRPVAYLEEARKGLRRMARIVGELLEFSRSTNDMAEAVTIRQALDDAVKSLEGKAKQQNVELRLSVADDLPPLESASLYQVFTNLIKNAIEAMPDGGRVETVAMLAAGAVEIRVADTGPGIPEKRLGTIFEPFYSTKEPGQGTGLGLAICKDIVEKHGGTLVARNRAEGGAEFVVRIPTHAIRPQDRPPGSCGNH